MSLEHRLRRGVTSFANYSWQAVPKVLAAKGSQERYPLAEVAPGPRHRFNVGARYDGPTVFADLELSYTSRTFWDDVLLYANVVQGLRAWRREVGQDLDAVLVRRIGRSLGDWLRRHGPILAQLR